MPPKGQGLLVTQGKARTVGLDGPEFGQNLSPSRFRLPGQQEIHFHADGLPSIHFHPLGQLEGLVRFLIATSFQKHDQLGVAVLITEWARIQKHVHIQASRMGRDGPGEE